LVTVYAIVAIPATTPVTTPEVETLATEALADDHTPPVVALSSVVFAPTQTFVAPVSAAIVGKALTVTTVEAAVAEQPAAFVTAT
jgi:hypothetical protein